MPKWKRENLIISREPWSTWKWTKNIFIFPFSSLRLHSLSFTFSHASLNTNETEWNKKKFNYQTEVSKLFELYLFYVGGLVNVSSVVEYFRACQACEKKSWIMKNCVEFKIPIFKVSLLVFNFLNSICWLFTIFNSKLSLICSWGYPKVRKKYTKCDDDSIKPSLSYF